MYDLLCVYCRGGIVITFTGTNMDVAQEPKLIIDSASVSAFLIHYNGVLKQLCVYLFL